MGNTSNQNYEKLLISSSPELLARHQSAKGFPKGSIVFVHGICHGAWCFENFMDFFSENGYECFALNLRGHGDNRRKGLIFATLEQYAIDVGLCVDYCINYCAKRGINEKPFLLGHSMGGAVVQKYIGNHYNKLKGAILFASATAGGMSLGKTIKDSLTHWNLFLANLVAYGLKRIMTSNAICKSAFFDKQIKIEKVNIYKKNLHRESIIIIFRDLYQEYTNNYSIDIPVFVMGSDKDAYFPKDSLDITSNGEYYDTTPMILKGLCHDMMLGYKWKIAAQSILEFLEHPIDLKDNPNKFIKDLYKKIYPDRKP